MNINPLTGRIDAPADEVADVVKCAMLAQQADMNERLAPIRAEIVRALEVGNDPASLVALLESERIAMMCGESNLSGFAIMQRGLEYRRKHGIQD